MRLLFAAIYHHDHDSVDVRLAVSRDGRAFSWLSYEPIIKLGAAGEWDGGSIYAQPNLVQLPDGRLALPYDGYNTTHNEVWFKNFYGDYDSKSGIAWALWKDARLAGIEAAQLGQFTTNLRPLRRQANPDQRPHRRRRQRRNRTARDAASRSMVARSPTASRSAATKIWADCRWKGRQDLNDLRGRSLELGVRLRTAKIFACRFV